MEAVLYDAITFPKTEVTANSLHIVSDSAIQKGNEENFSIKRQVTEHADSTDQLPSTIFNYEVAASSFLKRYTPDFSSSDVQIYSPLSVSIPDPTSQTEKTTSTGHFSSSQTVAIYPSNQLSTDLLRGFPLSNNPSQPTNQVAQVEPNITNINSDKLHHENQSEHRFHTHSINLQTTSTSAISMAQVTPVSQLADMQPTDWAMQALQSLVERYGIISGYPDGTFRGDHPLTRNEFAASLNAVLNYIQAQVEANSIGAISQEDTTLLRKLQQDFAAELTTLQGRVDSLEAPTTALEAQQFSTTTKLSGEARLSLVTVEGGDASETEDVNPIFGHLTKLQFNTSFSGEDLLFVELLEGNFDSSVFANSGSPGVNMVRVAEQADTGDVILSVLEYQFPAFNDQVIVSIKPVGFALSNALNNNSPLDNRALSLFGEFNPVLSIGGLNAGIDLHWLITERLQLQFGYGARNGSDPTAGLFNSDHRAFGVQLYAEPTDNITTGIAYINAYSEDGRLDTYTGSLNADRSGGLNERARIHAFSGTLQWRLLPNVLLTSWVGFVNTESLESKAQAKLTTYTFALHFLEPFGREGDALVFLFGQPLKLVDGNFVEEDEGTSLHYEVFYELRLNENVSLTPGFFVITNPEHISENDSIFVGMIRSVLRF